LAVLCSQHLAAATAMMFVKRLRPEASLPVRGSSLAAGFDLAASEAATVPSGSKAIVKTGLSLAVPKGTYARLAPRSGLAAKKMIDVGAGVVDSDYRGEIGVVLFNHGPEDFAVAAGDRVAQLVVEKINMCSCEEVQTLDETVRGAGGYGSTGVTGAAVAELSESPEKKKARLEDGLLLVKKLREEAVLPKKGSEEAAGFDLSAAEVTTVPAGGKAIAKTGLSVAVPEGTYARIAPRSGLAAKNMIHCGAGVVDFDYRGEVGVVLFNYGPTDFVVNAGDRVAQMILEEVNMAGVVEVDTLDETERGSGGFGSTGVAEATTATEASGASLPSSTVAAGLLRAKKLVPEASLPIRGSAHAAGFDLAAAQTVSVPARGKAIVKTGLSVAIPEGTYARLAPRSGLAAKKMIHVGAGVVDADYRGEVGVVLFNHGPEAFEVAIGDRVAQLILEKNDMLSCEEVDSLENTARGAGGFGSTGVASKAEPVALPTATVQKIELGA